MSYRTLKEWNARGRMVKRGEKAMGRLNDGTLLFGKEQTKKSPKPVPRGYLDDPDYDREEDQELGLCMGLPGQW